LLEIRDFADGSPGFLTGLTVNVMIAPVVSFEKVSPGEATFRRAAVP